MYGGLGMSAPSLHRESTDSLIINYYYTMRADGVFTMCFVACSSLYPDNDKAALTSVVSGITAFSIFLG